MISSDMNKYYLVDDLKNLNHSVGIVGVKNSDDAEAMRHADFALC